MTDRPHPHAVSVPAVFKAEPEDFVVQELEAPPRRPREGEEAEAPSAPDHLWLWVEKRDFTTPEAARRIARALGLPASAASWAGMKDRRAVTQQWISVPGIEHDWQSVELEGIRIERAKTAVGKLRPGQLAGNRFAIVLREVPEDAVAGLSARLDQLSAGMPNYFGDQRFGRDNLDVARRWIVDGGKAPRDRFQRKMVVSALQSEGFNQVLAERVRRGTMAVAMVGDRMKREDTGGLFLVDDAVEAQARVDRWEISPTGPLFGKKMPKVEGAVRTLEEAFQTSLGLTPEALRRMGKLGRGTRRPLRVRLDQASLETPAPGQVRLKFGLPAGSYATEVLRALFGDGAQAATEGPSRQTETLALDTASQ